MASLLRRGLTEEGHAVDVARTGDDALWMAACGRVRRDRARPHAAGRRRHRGVPARAGEWCVGSRPDAHRPRCGRGSGRGARCGRGRLPAEAVLVRRASRQDSRARAPRRHRAPGRARGRRPRASIPRRARCGGDPTEVKLSAKEFALLETFMRRPGAVLSRYQLLEHAWDYALREPLERRRRVRPVSPRQDRQTLRM